MYLRDKAIREIHSTEEMLEIISKSRVCHIGFVDNGMPYVLAFNFGFSNNTVYLHCAKEGQKLNILKNNNNVCVEFDSDHELFARNEEVACSWRMRYKSVVAWGKAELISDFDEKVTALNIFMKNYSDINFTFSEPSVNNVNIIAIKINKMTGRKFEYL